MTPSLKYQDCDETIDYTPGSAVTAGDVVVVGAIPYFAPQDIAANVKGALTIKGLWRVPKITGAVTLGADVFWNPTGDPVTGSAGTGAATVTPTAGSYFMGQAVLAADSGDSYVVVRPIPTGQSARIPTGTVAAAGSVQGDATALREGFNLVSAADGTKGVILPAAVAGKVVEVKNGAAAILKIYPATGDAINAIAANGAFSIASLTSVRLISYDSTTWYSIPLLPS